MGSQLRDLLDPDENTGWIYGDGAYDCVDR
ncbi:hypothetical protein ABH925_007223 [Streptacidiphilus sp. EB129]